MNKGILLFIGIVVFLLIFMHYNLEFIKEYKLIITFILALCFVFGLKIIK